jgi:gliding motility-associated-like protein
MVVFEIDTVDYCLNYTGVELGLDTACIVVCDDLGICDTTILIVEVVEDGDPPVAMMDIDTTLFNTGTIINIMVNDTIPGGIDTLYVAENPSNGTVTINPDLTLSYSPDNDYCDSTTPDEFSYVVCNTFGCDTATVQVYVFCEDLIFHTGFSPNGDGINDNFVVRNIESFPNSTLTIFNRWGNQVLFSRGYQNDWDGVWEGNPLPDGTYFYVLEDGEGNVFSGYVQIHR